MKVKLFLRLLLFLLPILCLVPLELKLRNNSFAIKSDYLKRHAEELELLFFGSSHVWRAVNPSFIEANSTSLALGGSSIDKDVALFYHVLNRLPNLKVVVFELSHHSLEHYNGGNWGKNHLLLNHFGLADYGGSPTPLTEWNLLTSQPILYAKQLYEDGILSDKIVYNEHGFIEGELNKEGEIVISDRFRKLNYNLKKIRETSHNYFGPKMIETHFKSDLKAFQLNSRLLDSAIDTCLERGIKVVLLSPPKHAIYNNLMNQERTNRRARFLEDQIEKDQVYMLDFTSLFDDNELFANENHLNQNGAERYSRIINEELKTILE